jgi:hypothetical protein
MESVEDLVSTDYVLRPNLTSDMQVTALEQIGRQGYIKMDTDILAE